MKWLVSDTEQQSSQDFKPCERQEINEVSTTITLGFQPGGTFWTMAQDKETVTKCGGITELRKQRQSSGRWGIFKAKYKRVLMTRTSWLFKLLVLHL